MTLFRCMRSVGPFASRPRPTSIPRASTLVDPLAESDEGPDHDSTTSIVLIVVHTPVYLHTPYLRTRHASTCSPIQSMPRLDARKGNLGPLVSAYLTTVKLNFGGSYLCRLHFPDSLVRRGVLEGLDHDFHFRMPIHSDCRSEGSAKKGGKKAKYSIPFQSLNCRYSEYWSTRIATS